MLSVTNETRAQWRELAGLVRIQGLRRTAMRLGIHHTTLYRTVVALEEGRGHSVRLDLYAALCEMLRGGPWE